MRNVAFGGAWSEQIDGNERLRLAVLRIEAAITETAEVDLRKDNDLKTALELVSAAHPKGAMLRDAWTKALGHTNAHHREAELTRIMCALKAGLGRRLDDVWK
ncbi:hypothetical protein D2T29_12460 [Sinirhodobacter populi]|uniref:Uncharacterized protein n=1 Tax=Paenirhodobacter populi TaxID=2306993 RepID=A0A443KCE7_9RHOB|nr:hypothetical protein [Sinirhodobacter populi]RWR30477.1 hypothetical protein D2T29_12460 [Sinirhodobacter populi]